LQLSPQQLPALHPHDQRLLPTETRSPGCPAAPEKNCFFFPFIWPRAHLFFFFCFSSSFGLGPILLFFFFFFPCVRRLHSGLFFLPFFFFLLCAFHQTINTGPVVLRSTLAKAYDTTQELSDPIPSSHTGFLFHAMLTTHNCFLPASANSTHCWHCAAVLITNIPNSIMFHRELFIMHIADGCSEFYHVSSQIQRCVVEPAALLAQSHALRLWAPSPDDEEQ
jgi:hypothetical protein